MQPLGFRPVSRDGFRAVNYLQHHEKPARTSRCRPCCEGFFCPQSLSCMIHGYLYQLPSGKTNHTCGGANIWADVSRDRSMFCSAGSYCSSTTTEITWASGGYAGLFNLCIVVFVTVNSRLIIENLMKYGWLIKSDFWFSMPWKGTKGLEDFSSKFMCGSACFIAFSTFGL